ncbi:hypothetical protein [Salinicoccus sp. HZC-1]|uniref:hypothetical protein n=1 Tax=Salinicoccus sp. HZC-1 TaxID=3385497 RepID=UPI00398A6BBC
MKKSNQEYALYKGEDIICIGTTAEISDFQGVQEKTIKFYLTPTYKKRIEKRKKPRNYLVLERLEDD